MEKDNLASLQTAQKWQSNYIKHYQAKRTMLGHLRLHIQKPIFLKRFMIIFFFPEYKLIEDTLQRKKLIF